MTENESLTSPRLVALKHALETGHRTALQTFWQEIDQQGTPLIEPINSADAYMLVTFLWRTDNAHDTVVVLSDLVGWNCYIPRNRLKRLLNSDLLYRTYRVRADARFTYVFSVNDPRVDPEYVKDHTNQTFTYRSDPLDRRLFPNHQVVAATNEWKVSEVELPAAPPQHWIRAQLGVPAGLLESYRLHSSILANERAVWVYTPSGYAPGDGPYHLLILFDGETYTHDIPIPTILDNLIAARQLPPL